MLFGSVLVVSYRLVTDPIFGSTDQSLTCVSVLLLITSGSHIPLWAPPIRAHLFSFFFFLYVAMATNSCTVALWQGEFPAGTTRVDTAQAVYHRFSPFHSAQSIQVLPGGIDSRILTSQLLPSPCVLLEVASQVLNYVQRSTHYFSAEDV